MTYAEKIIEKFGGASVLAHEISVPRTTVRGWIERGSIPDKYKPIVYRAAKRLDLDIHRLDMMPPLDA